MRKLGFRVWDKEDEAYLHITKNKEDGVVGISPDGKKVLYLEDGEVIILEDVIIEQYTGLKDKNGKEIYECDIVKVDKMFDAIAVGYDAGGFVLHNKDWDCVVPMSRDTDDVLGIGLGDICTTVEVIGNIHENKELLGCD